MASRNLRRSNEISRTEMSILTATIFVCLFVVSRILREYDAADKTGNGSKHPEHPSCEPGNQYIPSFTRAHYQTRPSAPLYPDVETERRADCFGEVGRWKPINTLNSHSN